MTHTHDKTSAMDDKRKAPMPPPPTAEEIESFHRSVEAYYKQKSQEKTCET